MAVLGSSESARATLVFSTSFEERDPLAPQPLGWGPAAEWLRSVPSGEAAWASDDARTGSRSLRLQVTAGPVAYEAEAVSCSSGEVQVLAAWIKADAETRGARIALRWIGEDRRTLFVSESAPSDGSGRWRRLELRVVPPPEASAAVPMCILSGPGRAWFDDVRLNSFPAVRVAVLKLEVPSSVEAGGVLALRIAVRAEARLERESAWVVELYPPEGRRPVMRREIRGSPPAAEWTPSTTYSVGSLELPLPKYAVPGNYLLRVSLQGVLLEGISPLPIEVAPGHALMPGARSPVRLALDAPEGVEAGKGLTVSISALSEDPILQPLRGYLTLERNGAVWEEESFTLLAANRTATATTISLVLPTGLKSGEYTLRAGLYGAPASQERAATSVMVHSGATGNGQWAMGNGQRSLVIGHWSWAPKRRSGGLFTDSDGAVHRWLVRPNGSLMWDGQAFVPVGGAIWTRFLADFSPEDERGNESRWQEFARRTQVLYDAGVRDVILSTSDLTACQPEALLRVIDRLEELRFSYGLQIGGPVDEGFLGYWITDRFNLRGIPGGAECQITLDYAPPEGGRAIVVAYDETAQRFHAPTVFPISAVSSPTGGPVGHLAFDLRGSPEDHLFHIYVVPQRWVPAGVGLGDIWSHLDQRRRALVESLRFLRPGPGFRFFLDPLGSDFQPGPADTIPAGQSLFPLAFAQWLGRRYALAELKEAWAIEGEMPSLGVAGRLVPVPVEKGKLLLVDPEVGYSYLVDGAKSAFLADLGAFREESAAGALETVAEDLKAHIADVPVVITDRWMVQGCDLAGTEGGHDGIGALSFGPPDQLPLFSAVTAVAQAALSPRTVWPLAVAMAPDFPLPASGAGYGTPAFLNECLDTLARMGARGFFHAAVSGEPGSPFAGSDLSSHPEQLAWLAAWKRARSADVARMEFPPLVPVVTPIAAQPGWKDDRGAPWGGVGSLGQGSAVLWVRGDASAQRPPLDPTGDWGWLVPSPGTIPTGFPRVLWRVPSVEDTPGVAAWGSRCLKDLAASLTDPPSGLVIIPPSSPCGIPELDAMTTGERVALPDGRTALALRPPPDAEVLGEWGPNVWHYRRGNLEVVGLPEASPVEVLELVLR